MVVEEVIFINGVDLDWIYFYNLKILMDKWIMIC